MAGRSKSTRISGGDHSVVVGNQINNTNIVIGGSGNASSTTINLPAIFDRFYEKLQDNKAIPPQEMADIKAELQDAQQELEKPEPDESFLARRFRNVKRMAPEIVEVAFETLKNPISGVSEVIKKVAQKMTEDAGPKE